jgi:hypothetical protein
LVKRGRNSKFAPKSVEGFLLGYDSNTRAYRVFNKSTGLVEVSYDIVFDETNGSQVEQVDIDELDEEEAPCTALRNMYIRDICPQVLEEPTPTQDQPSSSVQASPPTQDENKLRNKKIKFKTMSHLKMMTLIKGDEEQEIQAQRPHHPRVHQAIQRNQPVISSLGDIQKG